MVPYLTMDAIAATLAFIAGVPGAEVVFDYAVPRERLAPERRTQVDVLSAQVAAVGEPLRSALDPGALAAQLRELGFGEVEDLGPGDIRARVTGAPAGRREGGDGPHVVRARRL